MGRRETVSRKARLTRCPAPQGRPPGTVGKGAAGRHPLGPGFGVCEFSFRGFHIDLQNLRILQGTLRTGKDGHRPWRHAFCPESPQSEPTAFSTSQQTPHSPAQTHTSIMDYPLHFQGAPD